MKENEVCESTTPFINDTSLYQQGYVKIEVDHIQQRFRWDCGVTSVMMVLRPNERTQFERDFDKICEEEGFLNSTWTIDLAYLLNRFGSSCRYCTVTWGVDPKYDNQSFYKPILSKDENRVNSKFNEAKEKGMNVELRSVELDEIFHHLDTRNPAIVLVDANFIRCKTCSFSGFTCDAWIFQLCPSACQLDYTGHYIVVTGYDSSKRLVYYENPSVRQGECCMSYGDFNAARRAYGTDEDIIFIYNNCHGDTV